MWHWSRTLVYCRSDQSFNGNRALHRECGLPVVGNSVSIGIGIGVITGCRPRRVVGLRWTPWDSNFVAQLVEIDPQRCCSSINSRILAIGSLAIVPDQLHVGAELQRVVNIHRVQQLTHHLEVHMSLRCLSGVQRHAEDVCGSIAIDCIKHLPDLLHGA